MTEKRTLSLSALPIEHLVEAIPVIERAIIALEESVKLQSHYAGLLNVYDGGNRMQFVDADEWIRRLISTGTLAPPANSKR